MNTDLHAALWICLALASLSVACSISIFAVRWLAKRRVVPEMPSSTPTPPPLPKQFKPKNAPPLDCGGLFDFLRRRADAEIISAITGQMPLKVAMVLEFLPFDQRARILEQLHPKRRIEIESMKAQLPSIPSDEYIRTADGLRRAFERDKEPEKIDDVVFWEKALKGSMEPGAILEALEKTRPDLLSVTQRHRVSVADLPSLPEGKLELVLAKLSDRELSVALSGCPRSTVERFLRSLSPQRRLRIVARVRAQGALPKSITEPAVKALVRRFQEALSFTVLMGLLGCTQPVVDRYSKMLEPQVGSATKKDMERLLGPPVRCVQEFNYENCEFRTARGRNHPVPAVHQRNTTMGPDLSPFEHFDVLSLQFDGFGVLQGWKPLRVE